MSAIFQFEHLAFYLIELCLVEYEALDYKPSMLCASAIYVARCTMQINPPWTSLLAKHARYEESQIRFVFYGLSYWKFWSKDLFNINSIIGLCRKCAEMIVKFHRAAKKSVLKVSYVKYAKLDYCRVATMKPLDRLPV